MAATLKQTPKGSGFSSGLNLVARARSLAEGRATAKLRSDDNLLSYGRSFVFDCAFLNFICIVALY